MVVKCPKCGQQLRGEPGASGTCPKCGQRLVFPRGDTNIGETVTCPHCGQKQIYRDGKCVNCGKSISGSKENSDHSPGINKKKKGKKKFLVIAALLLVVAVVAISRLQGFGLTDDEKNQRIADAYISDGYDAAMELVVKYYGTDTEEAFSWASVILDMEDEKVISDLEVVDHSLVLDGNYYDYEAQIKNNSDKAITYIQVDIFLYNENGDIVNTEWTNWSGTLLPGASTYLDTMIRDTGDIDRFRTEVSDITIE